jgi:hypothetical protein
MSASLPQGFQLPACNVLDKAARLLLDHAQSLADSVSIAGVPDWEHEPEAKASYDELVGTAEELKGVLAPILVL